LLTNTQIVKSDWWDTLISTVGDVVQTLGPLIIAASEGKSQTYVGQLKYDGFVLTGNGTQLIAQSTMNLTSLQVRNSIIDYNGIFYQANKTILPGHSLDISDVVNKYPMGTLEFTMLPVDFTVNCNQIKDFLAVAANVATIVGGAAQVYRSATSPTSIIIKNINSFNTISSDYRLSNNKGFVQTNSFILAPNTQTSLDMPSQKGVQSDYYLDLMSQVCQNGFLKAKNLI